MPAAAPEPEAAIRSPCLNICRVAELGGQSWCVGCWRSLQEIAQWRQMTEAERLAVMQALPERQQALTAAGGLPSSQ